MWEKQLIDEMKAAYEQNKRNNPRYSRRAFAKRMGLSPSSLSELFSNSRSWRLTPKRGAELVAKLDLPQTKRNRLYALMGVSPAIHRRHMQKEEQHIILSEWAALPILRCFDLPPEECTPAALSKRLGLNIDQVTAILRNLAKNGFLRAEANGTYVLSTPSLETSDNIPNELVRHYHRENLKVAARALDAVPTNQRDFTALVASGSAKNMEIIRKEIRSMRDRLEALLEVEEDCGEIFNLSVQFFPVNFSQEKHHA